MSGVARRTVIVAAATFAQRSHGVQPDHHRHQGVVVARKWRKAIASPARRRRRLQNPQAVSELELDSSATMQKKHIAALGASVQHVLYACIINSIAADKETHAFGHCCCFCFRPTPHTVRTGARLTFTATTRPRPVGSRHRRTRSMGVIFAHLPTEPPAQAASWPGRLSMADVCLTAFISGIMHKIRKYWKSGAAPFE